LIPRAPTSWSFPTPPPPGGGAALPFTLSPSVGGDGGQFIVGLVDSGVQPLGADLSAFLLPALTVDPGHIPSGATPGHGTSMAETILRGIDIATQGGTSNVRLLPVDVYGSRETTTTFDLAWGISSAIERGATVINLSLGTDQPSGLLETLIRNSTEKGVVFLAAAGNTPTTAPTYPAAFPQVTAVTAGSPNGTLASFANRGTFVDAVGPGTARVSFAGSTWMVSGTSPATAFMSGLTAGLAASSGSTPRVAVQSVVNRFPFNPGTKGGTSSAR
jgi:thermitase